MTHTRYRYLFKNKGNFVYNYKLKKYEHMSETPMQYNFKEIQDIKKDLWKHVSEGLNTELSTSELMLGKYDKKVYQKCRYCHCVIEIKKAFTKEEVSAISA